MNKKRLLLTFTHGSSPPPGAPPPMLTANQMIHYTFNDARKGLKVLNASGEPCEIVDADFRKPGKGQGTTTVKLRSIRSGRITEEVLKSSDTLPAADLVEIPMQLLYREDELWHFLDPATGDQVIADAGAMGDAVRWLKNETICEVSLWDGVPLRVQAPAFVELAVVDTDPGVRGDTSGGGGKPAQLETGAMVRVPLFVGRGETVRVDTRSGEYVGRAAQG